MVQVEEARVLQCRSRRVRPSEHPAPRADARPAGPPCLASRARLGRSYIPSNTFSSYVFNPQALQDEADRPDEDDELTPPPPPDVALEINLSHLIECLNIFGGAGGGGGGVGADAGEGKRRGSWGGTADDDHEDDDGGGAGGWGGGGRKGKGGAEGGARTGKVTAGRISWHGPGEPLEVLLCVSTFPSWPAPALPQPRAR